MSFAIVPACGHSTRMGRPKLSLPLGDRTVIEHVVAALRDGGVEHVLVVVGPHVPELIPLAHAAGADALPLAEPTPDMRATVERGLVYLDKRYHPNPDDLWFLTPADHPVLNPNVVRQLLAASTTSPASVIVPVHQGRRGHPTLIRWRHARGILAFPTGQGINAYLRSYMSATLELPVEDGSVLADLDTPEELTRLQQALASGRAARTSDLGHHR
jgi:CTP:molybdopterin cytidylyltransferase MocA